MTDEKNELNHGEELRRLYRILSAVHIAAVDYVRGKEEKIDMDAAAKRAKEVADFFQPMLKKGGLAKMTGNDVENAPRMAFLMQQGDCDPGGCWDPITKQCVDC